ncbi:branched-chain amino acid ABC transporter permease [Variovorax sp. EL159]|uniref:branched-chain amino acid ABC transporter permease n=1 Tax=Variovorax sp. EL159 TaxID=1566270 RepID=UPI00088BE44F|nr:branched-chain amino acid ABC transporter permease [Variovorax sp. EL159]SCX72519.1 branched-chain amino acid transport system permease protein [Variovorax sp. EL159]
MNRWLLLIPVVLYAYVLGADDYYVMFATRAMILAIFALSLNLLVGYGGLMSLGHSAFFGIASYTVAWLIVKKEWNPGEAVLCALALSTSAAGLFGVLALRARGIGFLMITLALGQIVWGIAVRWVDLTGGDNGIRGVVRPVVFGVELDDARSFYAFTGAIFFGVCVAIGCIVRSPFGASLRGTRDQPRRMSALGFNVWLIRWSAFVLAGFLAAVAGILDVYLNKFVSPEVVSLSLSAQALLMVIVGGSSTLMGPVLGTIVVLVFGHFVAAVIDRWTTALGVLFVAIVMFMPDGLLPGALRLWARSRGGAEGGSTVRTPIAEERA